MADDSLIPGLDISSYSPEKLNRLQQFVDVFTKLESFHGKAVSPVAVSGVTEFNSSLVETNKLLSEMNAKLSSIASSNRSFSSSNSTNTRSQTEFNLAIAQYVKNADQAANTAAKLSVATSDQAKETIALKLQLSEVTKQMIEEAKIGNQLVQNKLAQKEADRERKEELNQLIAALKAEIVLEQELKASNLAAANLAKKESERELKIEEQQRIAALKAEIVLEEEDAAAKKADARATLQLASDYKILNIALADQAIAYSNAYIAGDKKGKDPNSQAALKEYMSTKAIIKDIDGNLARTNGRFGAMGVYLTKNLSLLRNLAYILPGIGLAGIFNLGFEAISKVLDETGLFNSALENQIKYEKALNKTLAERLEINEKLYQLDKQLQNSPGGARIDPKTGISIDESRGYNQRLLLEKKFQLADFNNQKSTAEITAVAGNSPESLKSDLGRRLSVIQDYSNKIGKIQERIDATDASNPNDKRKGNRRNGESQQAFLNRTSSLVSSKNENVDLLKTQKESLEGAQKIKQDEYNRDKALLDTYLSSQEEYFKSKASLEKFNEDQHRKFVTENTKNDIAVLQEKYKQEESSDLSSEKEKLAAVYKIREDQKRLNQSEFENIKNNLSSVVGSDGDVEIAKNALNDKNRIADLNFEKDSLRIKTEFYQKDLKAVTETEKNKADAIAIENEKIFKNTEKSLDERILAYKEYIKQKDRIADLEYNLSIQSGASELGGKTNLTEKQKAEIVSNRDKNKENLRADSEKTLYDIVYSSAQNQLKVVKDSNSLQNENYNKTYADELEQLNKSFQDKQLGYKAFIEKKRDLDNRFNIESREFALKNDRQELTRIRENIKTQELEKQKLEDQYNSAPNLKASNDALSELNAKKDSIVEAKKYELEVQAKYNDDSRKLEEAKAALEVEGKKEIAANNKAIEEGLFNFSKQIIDQRTEYEIAAIERKQQVIDESYASEQAAIERSSLSAKEKAALDIQLAEQKKESDKAALAEERRLKREAAVIDRELAIANIIWSTEQAIINQAKIPVVGLALAVQAGVLGAIALATVLATPIPSFAEGVLGFEGGIARYGEDGPEVVKKPYQSPYLVSGETIGYLPPGTDIIPLKSPVFDNRAEDSSWEQTKFLAEQIKKSKESKTIVKNVIVVNIDQSYRKRILGN